MSEPLTPIELRRLFERSKRLQLSYGEWIEVINRFPATADLIDQLKASIQLRDNTDAMQRGKR